MECVRVCVLWQTNAQQSNFDVKECFFVCIPSILNEITFNENGECNVNQFVCVVFLSFVSWKIEAKEIKKTLENVFFG